MSSDASVSCEDYVMERAAELGAVQALQPADRHPVAISTAVSQHNSTIVAALCNDGTVWEYFAATGEWYQLPAIPQPTAQETR